MGIGLVPEIMARKSIEEGSIVRLDIRPLPLKRTLYFAVPDRNDVPSACMVILAYLGQGSYNSRTKFAHYTDSVPESCGQRSYVIRTRTLSQRDKLTSYVVKYHKTASPSSAGGWCSTEGRRDGPFKSKRYAFLTNRSRIASAMV